MCNVLSFIRTACRLLLAAASLLGTAIRRILTQVSAMTSPSKSSDDTLVPIIPARVQAQRTMLECTLQRNSGHTAAYS